MDFTCVLSTDQRGGLGYQNLLPWSASIAGRDDLKDFKRYTTKTPGTAVIMGRKTRDSIPSFPLKRRVNVVLTRQVSDVTIDDTVTYSDETRVVYVPSLESALTWCATQAIPKVMVIGGLEVFRLAMVHPQCRKVRITTLPGFYTCDTYFDSDAVLGENYQQKCQYTRDTGCVVTVYTRC